MSDTNLKKLNRAFKNQQIYKEGYQRGLLKAAEVAGEYSKELYNQRGMMYTPVSEVAETIMKKLRQMAEEGK